MRIKERLQHIIKNSLIKLNIEKKISEIIIESSNEKNNGDYYTNIAISLSKDLHKKPKEIADILKKIINDEMIEKLDVVYPGTIVIYLNKNYLLNGISEIIEKNINYGKSNIGEERKINIDFINTNIEKNITKENLFNAIYGDNLSRILKFNGFEIVKEFYLNDTSPNLDKQANITKERYNNFCTCKNDLTLNAEKNFEIRDTAYNIFSLYGDAKKYEEISYFKKEEISTLIEKRKRELDKYRINFNTYSNEQTLYDKGIVDSILDRLNRKGYTYFNEDKLWLKTTDYNDEKDRILIESDGSYTYLLPQASYYTEKLTKKYDGIISIYEKEYDSKKNTIKPVLKMLEQDTNRIELKLLPEIKLIKDKQDIEYINNNNISVNEIRYIFALHEIKNEIEINFDLSNSINNIDYIENANITLYRILSNYNKKITKVKNFSTIEYEKAYIILNKLYEFEDIVILSGLKQIPHLICNYLYELVTLFNNYYENEQIITEDEIYTNERLNLLLAIKIVINNALDLIGIIPREEK